MYTTKDKNDSIIGKKLQEKDKKSIQVSKSPHSFIQYKI